MVLVLACAGGLGLLLLGLDRLPGVFVDVSKIPDPSDRAEALNAARTPVGVVMAALLGGAAATFGVLTTRKSLQLTDKSLSITEQTVALAKAKSDADEKQWRQDHLTKRFHEATTALGSERPAIRLTGVAELTSLAEEEDDDWQWRCVDALISYLSLPDEEGENRTGAESRVRQAIWRSIADKTIRNKGRGGAWSNRRWTFQDVDIRENVTIRDSLLSSFVMKGVNFSDCRFSIGAALRRRVTLEEVSVESGAEVILGFYGELLYADIRDLKVKAAELTLLLDTDLLLHEERFRDRFDASEVIVSEGGRFRLALDGGEQSGDQRITFADIQLHAACFELLASDETVDCTVFLPSVTVTGSSTIYLDRSEDLASAWRLEGHLEAASDGPLAISVRTVGGGEVELARFEPGDDFSVSMAANSTALQAPSRPA